MLNWIFARNLRLTLSGVEKIPYGRLWKEKSDVASTLMKDILSLTVVVNTTYGVNELGTAEHFQMWNFGQARLPLYSQSHGSPGIHPNPGVNANQRAKWLSKTVIQTPICC